MVTVTSRQREEDEKQRGVIPLVIGILQFILDPETTIEWITMGEKKRENNSNF